MQNKKESKTYEKYSELRDKLGYSDYRVSLETGISKSMFSEWKAGRSNPKADKLLLLANLFGVTIEYFLTE